MGKSTIVPGELVLAEGQSVQWLAGGSHDGAFPKLATAEPGGFNSLLELYGVTKRQGLTKPERRVDGFS